MPNTSKVSAGEPSRSAPVNSAGWINGVSEMLDWFNRTVKTGGGAGVGPALESTSGMVKVKNLTAADLVRGHYVQLGDYLLTDVSHRHQWYEGNLYDAAVDGRIAIVAAAIKTADTGFHDARCLGKCTARVNITDTGHRFAVPSDGLKVLQSAASGQVEILSTNKISGTGEQELAVLLGGGGSTTNLTSFAVVTDDAGASTHGSSGVSLGTTGLCVLLDENGAKTATDEIEFKSMHRVGIPVDAIIQLSAPNEIVPGSEWDDNAVLGMFVDSVDELAQLTGFGATTSLSVPEAGTDAEDIQWAGGECEE